MTHAKYTFELFSLYTKEQLALSRALDSLAEHPDEALPLPGDRTVRLSEDGTFDIRYADGEFAVGRPIALSAYRAHPVRTLRELSERLVL